MKAVGQVFQKFPGHRATSSFSLFLSRPALKADWKIVQIASSKKTCYFIWVCNGFDRWKMHLETSALLQDMYFKNVIRFILHHFRKAINMEADNRKAFYSRGNVSSRHSQQATCSPSHRGIHYVVCRYAAYVSIDICFRLLLAPWVILVSGHFLQKILVIVFTRSSTLTKVWRALWHSTKRQIIISSVLKHWLWVKSVILRFQFQDVLGLSCKGNITFFLHWYIFSSTFPSLSLCHKSLGGLPFAW